MFMTVSTITVPSIVKFLSILCLVYVRASLFAGMILTIPANLLLGASAIVGSSGGIIKVAAYLSKSSATVLVLAGKFLSSSLSSLFLFASNRTVNNWKQNRAKVANRETATKQCTL